MDLVTIIFIALAAFVFYRLFNVLGRRTGHERPPGMRGGRGEAQDNVVRLPDQKGEAPEAEDRRFTGDDALAAGLTQIRIADPEFDLDYFLAGARSAFEMIIEGFARGDLDELRPLLDDDVYRRFAAAVKEREQAGETRETEITAFETVEPIEAGIEKKIAAITIKFVTEQVDITKDSEGRIIAGEPGESITVTDIWTFKRDTRSRDPNWLLAATRSPD